MAEWETNLMIAAVAGLAIGGFALSIVLRRVPVWFIAAVLGGWAVVMLTAGIWYASCPGCTSHASYDSGRNIDLMMAILWGGFYAACILGSSWLGAGLSILLRRALRPKRAFGRQRFPQ